MSVKMVKIPDRRKVGRRVGDKKNQQVKLSVTLKAEVFARDKGRCFCCGLKLNGNASYDHFIPRSWGGTNEIDNIFLCCQSTNTFFGSKSPGKKLQMILSSSNRKLDCVQISKIMRVPLEQQPSEGK